MPDLSQHIVWPEHASLCACTLCACVDRPISQPILGRIRKIRDMYGIRETSQSWLWCLSTCTQACMHASLHAHYFLACLGPYLREIMSDQRYQSIYGIRRTCKICMNIKFDPSMQASVHAPMYLCALVNNSAKLGPIREIKVSMESGEHA